MRTFLMLAALGLAGCNDTTTNTHPTPVPPGCAVTVTCDPLAGFPSVYRCTLNPDQNATWQVNGATVGDPQGVLVASTGDTVTVCPASCVGACLPSFILR